MALSLFDSFHIDLDLMTAIGRSFINGDIEAPTRKAMSSGSEVI